MVLLCAHLLSLDADADTVRGATTANVAATGGTRPHGGEGPLTAGAGIQALSFYRNLATLSAPDTGLYVHRIDWRDPSFPQEQNWKATYLSGKVVQNAANAPVDLIYPLGAPPPSVPPLELTIGGAPDPIVGSFIAVHGAAPGTIDVQKQQGSNPYVLSALGAPDSIAFFRTAGPDGEWSLDMDFPSPRVRVYGTCVWLFDRGFRVKGTLQVQGGTAPSDMLVLVGGRQTGDSEDPGAGIALLGSINSPNVPVILISDGNVLVEHRDFGGAWAADNYPSAISCLSIFARSARIMGPDANYVYDATGAKLVFGHPANHPANAIIDRLVNRGYLPNTIELGFDFTPHTLSLTSQGRWVTGFLEPVPPFTAGDVDVASIRLNGTVPVDPTAPSALGDHDRNGILDLMVKFDREAAERTVSEGDKVPVDVSGMLGSHSFHGTDYVRVGRADQAKVAEVPAESPEETSELDGVPGVSEELSIDARVGLGDHGPTQFALRGAKPNPAQSALKVSFSLPDSKPATLALFDVSGRQWVARPVEGMGPGWHTVTLGGRSTLPAGVYVIRLTQEGRSLTTRAAVVR